MKRKRIVLSGIVQGVGFRPHAYRNANRLHLSGWVQNTPGGVVIEVEGHAVDAFLDELLAGLPPLCRVDKTRIEDIPSRLDRGFQILPSLQEGVGDSPVSADVALCPQCMKEFADSRNRRHAYPFINCTDCGPRFTIIRKMPYDRPFTTMAPFPMCTACRNEYEDPKNRRYHAQPISCPRCGPVLSLVPAMEGQRFQPLTEAVRILLKDKIVAVKGIGGYHLACRAGAIDAVLRLREKKGREAKPFALMATLPMVERECHVSPVEKKWLQSPAAPILLLRRRKNSTIPDEVARGLSRLGFMLPYTGLHLRLVEGVGEPLVMTSANLADEPIQCEDDLRQLQSLADAVLTHDRGIEVFADDSVLQTSGDHIQIVRRSRGFVPYDIRLPISAKRTVLGVGAMLKGTFSFLKGDRALVSQYIATLESRQSLVAELRLIRHFMRLFSLEPEIVAVDAHPLYPSRTLAGEFPHCPRFEVQHHRAHVAALMAENGHEGEMIGVALDGTGFGDDGTIWGGEFFVGGFSALQRVGHLRSLFLSGGDTAVHEPWRFALSILHDLPGKQEEARALADRFGEAGQRQLDAVVHRAAGIPTTSCGRVFDAVAVLLGMGWRNAYDGELPSLLQAQAERARGGKKVYEWSIERQDGKRILDILPAIDAMIDDRSSLSQRAAAFHRTLAHGIADMASRIRDDTGLNCIGLTGGVFQNLLLQDMTAQALRQGGFVVLLHRHIPPNDSGISLGQAVLAVSMAKALS